MGLLETIEGVQFIHIRALQPVSKEGEKVYKEETLLKAESKQLVFSLSAKYNPDVYLLKLMLDTETFFSSPLLATCLAA